MWNRRVSYFQCHSIQVSDFGTMGSLLSTWSNLFQFHLDDPDARPEDVVVTASHAIFHTEDKRSAPVAVVGFQFQHSALLTLFKNTTSNVSPTDQIRAKVGNQPTLKIHFSFPVRWQLCEDLLYHHWSRNRLLRFRQSWFYYIIVESKWYGSIFRRSQWPFDATSHFRKYLRRSEYHRLSSRMPSG